MVPAMPSGCTGWRRGGVGREVNVVEGHLIPTLLYGRVLASVLSESALAACRAARRSVAAAAAVSPASRRATSVPTVNASREPSPALAVKAPPTVATPSALPTWVAVLSRDRRRANHAAVSANRRGPPLGGHSDVDRG